MANLYERRYEVTYSIARKLHQLHLDQHKIAQTALSMTGNALEVRYGCLLTFKDDYSIDHAYILGAEGGATVSVELWNLLLTQGLVGFVRHSQRTIIIRNINTDPRWPTLPNAPYIPQAGSAIGLPLKNQDNVYGVMLLIHTELDYFDQQRVEVLEEIALVTSAALGNALDFHAVRTSDARYQALFEDSVVPVILTDTRGLIVDVNARACDFLGRDRGALLHLSLSKIHPMEQAIFQGRLQAIIHGEETVFRTTAMNDQKEEVPVTVRGRGIRLGQRDLIEWVEQDVTAQMELEQLRRDLAAMVYHDLRGPLQSIKGSINKLGQVLANHENPAVWTLLQIGIRSTRQLQRMVDSLLDIQRLEEGRAVLNRKPVELQVLLGDAAQLVQPLAMESGHKMSFALGSNLPLVLMDGDMIMRVVINLMENAIKYTPEDGVIVLSAEVQDQQLRVGVRDSGPGIPREMLRQVFDKFSRVKYKDAPKGVGLGLAFCRLAVEAHNGHIWVESEVGQGSEFIFTLPITQDPQTEGEKSEASTKVILATTA